MFSPFSLRLQNSLFTCRLGWKHPWGVRVRLAELLLAVVQRGYSEGPSEKAAELEGTLASRLWPPLCISAAVHDSLNPFLNFREYCRSGEHAPCGHSHQIFLHFQNQSAIGVSEKISLVEISNKGLLQWKRSVCCSGSAAAQQSC